MPDVPILRAAPNAERTGGGHRGGGRPGARVFGFRIRADEKAPLAAAVVIADSDLELQDTEIVGAVTGVEIRGKSAAGAARQLHPGLPRHGHPHIRRIRAVAVVQCHPAQWTAPSAKRMPGPACSIEAPARPVLIGNIFADNGGEPVRLPEEHGYGSRSRSSTSSCRRQAAARTPRRSATLMVIPERRKVGKYEILRKLGRGGMADVYLAQDTEHQRTVALKVIEQGPDADSRETIEAERRGSQLAGEPRGNRPARGARFSTPGDMDGYFVVAMEYVEGQDLSDLMRHGPGGSG